MSYVPNTSEEQQSMLESLGLSTLEDLLEPVPAEVRLQAPLDLPPALSEPDLKRLMSRMAARNQDLDRTISFLGARMTAQFPASYRIYSAAPNSSPRTRPISRK